MTTSKISPADSSKREMRPPSPAKRASPRAALIAALLGVFLVYLLGAWLIASTRSIWSPDTGARFIQMQALLQPGADWSVPYPAAALDPEHRNSPLYLFAFYREGRAYIHYSFLFALLSALFFRLFGYFGLLVLPVLAGMGTALTVYALARALRLRFPIAPLLLAALATPLAIYSVVFWDHTITTGLAAAALYLCIRAITTGRLWLWFIAGAAVGAGYWFHEIMLPYLPALVAGAWWVRRRVPWLQASALVILGAVLLLVPLALINKSVYGTFFGPHLSNNRLGSPGAVLQFLLNVPEWGSGALYTLFAWGDSSPAYSWQLREWLQNPGPQLVREVRVSQWMAVPVIAWFLLAVSGIWRRRGGWIPFLIVVAGMLANSAWVLSHRDWPHSLFLACPLLALAFGAARKPPARRADTGTTETLSAEKSEARQLAQTMGIVTVVYTIASLLKPNLGGTEWGARYLLITVPVLSLLVWSTVESLLPERGEKNGVASWQPGAKPVLAGMALLLAVSLVLQVHGFRIIHNMHQENRRLTDAFLQAPDDVIVSAVWWAPLCAAPAYPHKQILYAGEPAFPAIPLFEKMRAARVPGYTLIGFSPWNLSDFSRPYGYFALVDAARPTAQRLYTNRFALVEEIPQR